MSLRPLIAISVLCVGSACGTPSNQERWAQCPPEGVELQNCAIEGSIFIDGTIAETVAELDRLCESPCQDINSLSVSLKDMEFPRDVPPIARFRLYGELHLSGNDSMKSLEGLESVTRVGSLSLTGNKNLTSLKGLEGPFLDGDLELSDNDSLTSLDGLKSVKKLLSLTLNRNKNLASLKGLESIQEISLVEVMTNDSLTNLEGLEGLRTAYSISITGNSGLVDLTGLDRLEHLTTLIVTDNLVLQSLHGLETLPKIDGGLELEWNARLKSLDGLRNLGPSTWDQGLNITWNKVLPECEAEAFIQRVASSPSPLIAPEVHNNDTSAMCD